MDIEKVKKIRGRYRAANAKYAVARESWERRIFADAEYVSLCTLEEKRNRVYVRYMKAFRELPLMQRIKLNDVESQTSTEHAVSIWSPQSTRSKPQQRIQK